MIAYGYVAASVGVERSCSQGRLTLPYLRNRLEAETTRALLCLGEWSLLDLIRDDDLKDMAQLPDASGETKELAKDWDKIL